MKQILPPTPPPDGESEAPSAAAIAGGIGEVCYPQPGDMVASAYRGLDDPARNVAEIVDMVPQLLGLARCRICKQFMDITVDIPVGVVYHCTEPAVRHRHRLDAAEVHHWAWQAYLSNADRSPVPYRRCDAVTKRALYLRYLHAVELDPRVDAERLVTDMAWHTT